MCDVSFDVILIFISYMYLYLSHTPGHTLCEPPHKPCLLQGWQCTTAIWNTRKNWQKLISGQYGIEDLALDISGASLEITDQDLWLLKKWYSETRGLPGTFEDMKFTEYGGKRVQADVMVRITAGPRLEASEIEEAAHGASMYNLGSILVNGPAPGKNAASYKKKKKYGFYCFRSSDRFEKVWHYTTFVSLFGNGTLVAVVVLLRVNLSIQHDGYKASHDQWCMHNSEGVHITGLHFRLVKQNIVNMQPIPLQMNIEIGWNPSLEMPFPIQVPAGSLRKI